MNDFPRMSIYNKSGNFITEIDGNLRSVSWRLGEIGIAQAGFAYTNSKATPYNLRTGNLLLIEFANGFPDWAGAIDFPLLRDDSGIGITAYQGQHLLGWRDTATVAIFSATPPGEITEALILAANALAPTGITIQDLYAGSSFTRDYHVENLLTAIDGLAADSGYEYEIAPTRIKNKLFLDLYWKERAGIDRRDEVALVQGGLDANVGTVSISEQGPCYNHITVIGAGDDWASRPIKTAVDIESISKFGRRELSILRLEIADETTLQAIADEKLAVHKEPPVRLSLGNVTSSGPGLYSQYHVGDIVTVQALQSRGEWSFTGPARLIAREWAAGGTCSLIAEEVP